MSHRPYPVIQWRKCRARQGLATQGPRRKKDEEEEQPTQPLTTRELEVLQLIVGGLSNQAIAIALGISVHTLKGYVQAVFQKLLVTDRTQAAVKAIRLGLV